MFLKKIELVSFRNYDKQIVSFSNGVNIFLGENAQGKTNILESIHVLALTKSHRTAQDKELIQWNQEFSRIDAIIEKNNQPYSFQLIIHKKGKKAKIGTIEQKKLSQYIGQLYVVLFAPEDLFLIKGAPNIRRRFLDMELGQTNALYLSHLAKYTKLVKQRNAYLKNKIIDEDYFEILTEQLIEEASALVHYRLHYIHRLEKWAASINRVISQNKEQLTIQYQSQIQCSLDDTVDDLYKKYTILFKNGKDKELYQRKTLYGPHRDDISFFLNDKNVQMYGSQGQQRTVALSVKLAEIDLINEITGEYPILLLDDVLSELDDNRQTYLLKAIEEKVQTIITTTNIDGIKRHLIHQPKIFEVKEGCITDYG